MHLKKRFALAIVLLLLAGSVSSAAADMAPPLQPPGANPGLAEFVETDVVMVYEEVDIVVSEIADLYYADMGSAINAHVTARFQMVNRGEKFEDLQPLFPLNNTQESGDGYMNDPEIQNLTILVNDEAVHWDVIVTSNPFGDIPIRWAQFSAVFPPKMSTWVEVSYDIQSTGRFPEATFYYILETGSGWSGPIEEGHITLTLPYTASEENVLFGKHYMHPFHDKTSPGARFSGNQAIWDFYFLEPTSVNNWYATIIDPYTWQEVLNLRQRIDEGDVFAYAELTLVYDDILMERSIRTGTEKLIDESYAIYQEAIKLEPKNDDVLARFANFQLFLFEHDHPSSYGPSSIDEVYQSAQRALALNPDNDIANSVALWIEQGYDLTEISEYSLEVNGEQNSTTDKTPDPVAFPLDNIWIPLASGILITICIIVIVLRRKKGDSQ